MPRECERRRKRLPEYAEGTLSGRVGEALERHVGGCARCQAEAAELRSVMAAVRGITPEEPPDSLVPRVRRAVRQQTPAPVAIGRFWARLAVPVALLTGVIAVSFALRQPRPPQVLVPGVGVIEQSKELARQAPLAMEQVESGTAVETRDERASALRGTPADALTGGSRMPPETRTAAPARKPAPRVQSSGGQPRPHTRGDSLPGPHAPWKETPPKWRAGGGARGSGRQSGAGGFATEGARVGEERLQTVERADAAAPAEAEGPAAERTEALAAIDDGDTGRKQAAAPLSATVVLAKGGAGQVIALRVAAEQPATDFELKLGEAPPEKLTWRGDPGKPAYIPLAAEKLGPGPGAIPLTLRSPGGSREYVLFIPMLARLGESASRAPRMRIAGRSLRSVLAEFTALTGLVVLAEAPVEAPMAGEVPQVSPSAALERIASDNGLGVQRAGELAFTLTHAR